MILLSAGLERFMGKIIHEGTHAYDIVRIEELLYLGKTKSEIKSIMGDMESFEKRAYQEAAGSNEVDFETIDEMLEHIEVGYEGIQVPNKSIFATLLTFISLQESKRRVRSSQKNRWEVWENRPKINFRMTKGYKVDSNVNSFLDRYRDTFNLTQ